MDDSGNFPHLPSFEVSHGLPDLLISCTSSDRDNAGCPGRLCNGLSQGALNYGQRGVRVATFDKDGKYIKSWGQRGTKTGEFHTVHTIAIDAKDDIYVGDRENKRIQVFDDDGNFKTQYLNIGAP
jgi:NHL repeat